MAVNFAIFTAMVIVIVSSVACFGLGVFYMSRRQQGKSVWWIVGWGVVTVALGVAWIPQIVWGGVLREPNWILSFSDLIPTGTYTLHDRHGDYIFLTAPDNRIRIYHFWDANHLDKGKIPKRFYVLPTITGVHELASLTPPDLEPKR